MGASVSHKKAKVRVFPSIAAVRVVTKTMQYEYEYESINPTAAFFFHAASAYLAQVTRSEPAEHTSTHDVALLSSIRGPPTGRALATTRTF